MREVALGEPGGDPEAPEAVRELEAPEGGPYVGLESALAEPQPEGTETQAERPRPGPRASLRPLRGYHEAPLRRAFLCGRRRGVVRNGQARGPG